MKKTLLIIGLIVLFMSGCDLDIPIAPVVLATPLSTSSIYVTWWSVSAATSYDVYYRKGSDPIQFLVNTTQTSYTHSGLTRDTQYTYCVKSKNSNGESSFSLDAPARTFANPTGSSRMDAITITSTGVTGDLSSSFSEMWFTFTKTGEGKLSMWDISNSPNSDGLTADILITIYDASNNVFKSRDNLEIADLPVGSSNITEKADLTETWTGVHFVKVHTSGIGNYGTFKLAFADSP